MNKTIFYSWQNDLDKRTHRYFIEKCIKQALTVVENDAKIYMDYDRDTMGLMGSPDISDTIFDKIDRSILFVCDLSIINEMNAEKKMPNPNVLMELGYAVNRLGWDRIICLFDNTQCSIEDLPFDVRKQRITPFKPAQKGELKRISDILATNIKNLYSEGKLFNPLNDYMKGRIDTAFLEIAKRLSNFMFGTYSLSDGLSQINDLLSLSHEIILDRMCLCEFPAFIMLNTYSETANQLRDILKELFSSSYFPKEWAYTVISLLDWIRLYSYLVSRRSHTLFDVYGERKFSELTVVSATAINPSNPPNSLLVFEIYDKDGKRYVDTAGGRVVNTTQYPHSQPNELEKCLKVKESAYEVLAKKVFDFTELCKQWLHITDSEFIFDPDYYVIE